MQSRAPVQQRERLSTAGRCEQADVTLFGIDERELSRIQCIMGVIVQCLQPFRLQTIVRPPMLVREYKFRQGKHWSKAGGKPIYETACSSRKFVRFLRLVGQDYCCSHLANPCCGSYGLVEKASDSPAGLGEYTSVMHDLR